MNMPMHMEGCKELEAWALEVADAACAGLGRDRQACDRFDPFPEP